jgi:hypothetical protein
LRFVRLALQIKHFASVRNAFFVSSFWYQFNGDDMAISYEVTPHRSYVVLVRGLLPQCLPSRDIHQPNPSEPAAVLRFSNQAAAPFPVVCCMNMQFMPRHTSIMSSSSAAH